MMAARPMAALSAARPSMTIIPGRSGVSANRGSVSSEGRRERMPVPATSTITMNAAARARVSRMSPASTPPLDMPTATATINMASTSSMTAAPSTIRPESVRSAPSWSSAREVMPTEVAVKAAARKTLPSREKPKTVAIANPPAKGSATPRTATRAAVPPTRTRSPTRVRTPTSNSNSTAPIWANSSVSGVTWYKPSRAGPTMTPARISPTSVGWPSRLNSSSPILVATSKTNSWNRTWARSSTG